MWLCISYYSRDSEVHFTSALISLDNVPVCNCGEVAQLLTVRREDSINKGNNIVYVQ